MTRGGAGLVLGAMMFMAASCGGTAVTTTILPPHRLADPICPLAVIIAESPDQIPPGGRMIARFRVEGSSAGVSSERVRRRFREEAAKLGANRVLAVEITTPSTLSALGMSLVQGWHAMDREKLRSEALTDQQQTTAATTAVPTEPSFYGHGLAYAIFIPEDTLRTNLECPR